MDVITMRGATIKVPYSDYNYILGMVGLKFNKARHEFGNFCLIQLEFNSIDIVNNDPIKKKGCTSSHYARTVSCFQSDTFLSKCHFRIYEGLYDNNFNNKTFVSIEGSCENNTFYQTIHFTGEVGSFGYYISVV
jgi:hypothetical protein